MTRCLAVRRVVLTFGGGVRTGRFLQTIIVIAPLHPIRLNFGL
jgi:hypothetical protein